MLHFSIVSAASLPLPTAVPITSIYFHGMNEDHAMTPMLLMSAMETKSHTSLWDCRARLRLL